MQIAWAAVIFLSESVSGKVWIGSFQETGSNYSSAEGSGQLKSDSHLSIFLELSPLIEEKKERSEGRMLERLLEMVKASSLSLLYIEDYVVPDKIPACIELS